MKRRRTRLGRCGFLGAVLAGGLVVACGWDPGRPFDREAPQVNEALGQYDSGASDAAAEILEEYLTTGACKDGKIGTPLRVRDRSNGSFDLGLAMFRLAEAYGRRFGDEEIDAGMGDPTLNGLRGEQIECALSVVRAVAEDGAQPVGLRLRARYLEGNLLFLNAAYKEAVTAYDTALELVPAMGDGGPIGANSEAGSPYTVDGVGRDAAWNRAVALRRIEDKKNDGGEQSDGGDAGTGGDNSDQKDAGSSKDAGGKNQGKNKKDKKDKERDAGQKPSEDKDKKPDPAPDAGAEPPPPPSRQNQDDRILDQLENAPTVQQEAAKKRMGKRHVPAGMVDK